MKKRYFAILTVLLLIVQAVPALASGGFSTNSEAVEQAAKSVLMLEVYDADGNIIATGSGFVAFNNRTIVTNYHVVEGSEWLQANSDDGYQYMITKVLVADKDKDIAICGFQSPTDLPPLELNPEGSLKRAQPIVAIGSPKGITNTVSLGNISALYEEGGINWIQFTAPISPGSSGGALFDDDGKIIGVTSATYNDDQAQNINFAVHISEVVHLYENWDGVERKLSEYEDAVAVDAETSETPDAETYATPDPEPEPEPEQPAAVGSYETLQRGDFSVAVIKLQKALAALGYYNSEANGLFNADTEAAVAAFNMQNFGTDSGVADEKMQQLLFEGDPLPYGAQSDPEGEPKDETGYEPLQRGNFSVAVIKLQKALAALGYYNGEANGLFNADTEAAVAAFNMQNFGIDSGVADEKMQQLLFEGDPLPYGEQAQEISTGELPVYFPDDSVASLQRLDNNVLSVCFDVSNRSNKTVTEFLIYVYATDENGENLYGDNVYYLTTYTKVAPGETVDSVYFNIGESDRVYNLYAGIVNAVYEDGTVCSVPDWEVQYDQWIIGD